MPLMPSLRPVHRLIPETKGKSLDEIEGGVLYGQKAVVGSGPGSSTGGDSPILEGRTNVHTKSNGGKEVEVV